MYWVGLCLLVYFYLYFVYYCLYLCSLPVFILVNKSCIYNSRQKEEEVERRRISWRRGYCPQSGLVFSFHLSVGGVQRGALHFAGTTSSMRALPRSIWTTASGSVALFRCANIIYRTHSLGPNYQCRSANCYHLIPFLVQFSCFFSLCNILCYMQCEWVLSNIRKKNLHRKKQLHLR